MTEVEELRLKVGILWGMVDNLSEDSWKLKLDIAELEEKLTWAKIKEDLLIKEIHQLKEENNKLKKYLTI